MIVSFQKIPDWSKLWVFPSSKKIFPQQIESLTIAIENFLETWTNNGENLHCAYKLVYDRFIIITVDTSKTQLNLNTYEALTSFILHLETTLETTLLDRINVWYKQGDYVQFKELNEFKNLIKNKSVSSKTIVFDNMITTKQEFETDWEISISESWLSRFLK